MSRLQANPDTIAELVTVVANSTNEALIVAADNTGDGWVPVPVAAELAAAGRCVAVMPRRDLLVLDFDQPDDPNAATGLSECVELLRTAGARLVRLASGGQGRLHVWAAGVDADIRSVVIARAKRARIDVRGGNNLIRPPGVRHRTGVDMALLEPTSWDEAIERLRKQPGDSPGTAPAAPTPDDPPRHPAVPAADVHLLIADFPARLRQLLTDPEAVDVYGGDRSRLTMAVCNAAANAGVGFDQLRALLARPNVPAGDGYRARRAGNGYNRDTWLLGTWTKAVSTRRTRPITSRGEAHHRLRSTRHHVNSWQPRRRTGSTDIAVLRAALDLATEQGGPVAALSVRAVAERAGVGRQSAGKSLKRLRADGWCMLRRCSSYDRSAVWEIAVPPGLEHFATTEQHKDSIGQDQHNMSARTGTTHTSPLGGVGLDEVRANVDMSHDVFTYGALNNSGARVLEALLGGPGTDTELAQRVGLSRGTVYRMLRRLGSVGLAAKDPATRRWGVVGAITTERLDEVARELGVDGIGAQRAHKHTCERTQYRENLVHRGHSPLATRPLRAMELTHKRAQRVLVAPMTWPSGATHDPATYWSLPERGELRDEQLTTLGRQARGHPREDR